MLDRKDRCDRQRKNDGGQRPESVHEAHDNDSDSSTSITGDQTQGRAEEQGHAYGAQPHHQGDGTAVNDPAQQIPAELVGAQQVLPAGGFQGVFEIHLIGGIGSNL